MIKLKQKITIILLIILMTMVIASPLLNAEEQINIKAKSALLMDASTGQILFEKNSAEKLPPASITKIMTILLIMEALQNGDISLKDKVNISENAWKMGGSQVFLGIGEEQTVETLLKSIVIASGNDASVALAEHLMGSEKAFVNRMNERAKQLGMFNTNFMNCHGLHDENHYSTAYDIAVMTRELIKHDKVFEWSTVKLDYLEHTDKDRPATMLANTNKLIRWYEGADGLKTGSHSQALYCISATAKRGNLRLISVILGAPDSNSRFMEAAKLLDFGFENYDSIPIIGKWEKAGEVVVEKGIESNVNLIAERELNVLIKKGRKEEIQKEIQIPEKVTAPIKKGQSLGKLIIYSSGNKVDEVNLIAEKDINRANLLFITKKLFINLLKYF